MQYVFADVINKMIFTTTDYGRRFTKYNVDFRPKEISMHSTDEQLILAYDKDDPLKRVSVQLLLKLVEPFKVHSHGTSVTASKTDLTIEFSFAYRSIEVSDASVDVNRFICCRRTHCLRQDKLTLSQTLSHRVKEPLPCKEPVNTFLCTIPKNPAVNCTPILFKTNISILYTVNVLNIAHSPFFTTHPLFPAEIQIFLEVLQNYLPLIKTIFSTSS